jgi:[FeFe] hydrogenase H-cluster maturation GTPase HydF
MQTTPRGMRVQIGIFGRRNVGKSSVLNALTGQNVSIVSETPGTTTDPVEKAMELLPLGPVLFIDTAGIDDVGALGEQRIERSRRIIDRTDLALVVIDTPTLDDFERKLIEELEGRETPMVIVLNKVDAHGAGAASIDLESSSIPKVAMSAVNGTGVGDLRTAIIGSVPEEFISTPSIVGDLVPPGELAVLVVPIDLEAPKGRLILPQVQTIRDILDSDAYCMMVKERELSDALGRLNRPPRLVITDSQAFLKVSADVPPDIC